MCVYTHYIFFFCSSVDGHLGCFLILAIANNAAMNIRVHVSFQISVFVSFRYTPKSEIAGSYGSSKSFQVFENPSLFPSVASPAYIPTNSVGGFPFLTPSPTLVTFVLFDGSHSECYEVIYPIAVLICISLMINNIENIFTCLLAICIFSLEENVYQFFCPFEIRLFFDVECMSCLYMLGV